ncbi:THAP domain-containing protein 2, partial [Caligus rogercresseyi]
SLREPCIPIVSKEKALTLDERRKSVDITPKKLRYLQRQFKKLGSLLPDHIEYLSSQLQCPKSQIELCFSLYLEYIDIKAQRPQDPLELNENELLGMQDGLEGFEVLNF